MKINEYKKFISDNSMDSTLEKLYGNNEKNVQVQKERYSNAVEQFEKLYGDNREISIYSAPGRTEIGGNHTDHNLGIVVAAAVTVDVLCIASKNDTGIINTCSCNFKEIKPIDTNSLEKRTEETESTEGLIRGICAGIINHGGRCGGLDLYVDSNVLQGSGLSSSAAFEVAISATINYEFCDKMFNSTQLAQISQYAENEYFGKPSGLMDQMASSTGSLMTIDFQDIKVPIVTPIAFDLDAYNLALCVVNSGASHADLTEDYASIKRDMCSVANVFCKQHLRDVSYDTFINHMSYLREQVGDRGVLRAMHFYLECDRAIAIRKAIEENDIEKFLQKIIESGHSSFEYNQNAYTSKAPESQPVSVALCAAQSFLQNKRGAWRLQGGGF
ncbi:MAG: galactokinase family protein, partial [Oscillospiraceae bacterium]